MAGLGFDEKKDVIWWKRGQQTGCISDSLKMSWICTLLSGLPLTGGSPWNGGEYYEILRVFKEEKKKKTEKRKVGKLLGKIFYQTFTLDAGFIE